ncbi:hypothetical protein ACIRTB_20905 [Streptomyces sp. NPDC101158]|uniref:hypothetical protein n=1 Tax=Streptomyces sp. NPDC101158 TaxID=3366117 RepID=UPI00382BE94B
MHTPEDAEFDRMMRHQGFGEEPAPGFHDPHPYGPPPAAAPAFPQAKPGLTARGKVALGVGAAVLAGGALIGYQSHTESVAAAEAKAKELDVQAQLLRIEELKEMNRANEAARKSQNADEKTRQVSVDSCINKDKQLVGKGFGSPSYRDVIDNCLTRYGTKGDTKFETAASASQVTPQASTSGANSGLNGFLVLGIGALALLAGGAARRTAKNNS